MHSTVIRKLFWRCRMANGTEGLSANLRAGRIGTRPTTPSSCLVHCVLQAANSQDRFEFAGDHSTAAVNAWLSFRPKSASAGQPHAASSVKDRVRHNCSTLLSTSYRCVRNGVNHHFGKIDHQRQSHWVQVCGNPRWTEVVSDRCSHSAKPMNSSS